MTDPSRKFTEVQETELVLKLKKEELFDQRILLPHAEVNRVVYTSVDGFVEKYKGEGMTLSILTDPVSPAIQDVFREVYRAHYQDEYQRVARYLKRHLIRSVSLFLVCIGAFLLSRWISKAASGDTIFSYVVGNISCFCLWEIGYTHFAMRDVMNEKERINRAMNAVIEFQSTAGGRAL